ncbi:MAG: sigma-70 family RNA polymerase sigma factor [Dehalococcoidia bacterium]|nr:sigma-70 family RNA polymerase sigma factor [Dehalococcoidia bacterium]MDW8119732.1 sigma-70 family RNA polymerase sigma factor [Chloroflexota bacterium]
MAYRELGDLDLLALVAAGREEGLETLYDRYARAVFNVAYGVLQDTGAAEEVVQEVFLAVWQKAHTYSEARGSPRLWLLSIAHHRAIDLLRKRRREGTIDSDTPLPARSIPHQPPDDPVDEAIARERGARLLKALELLDPSQREVLLLTYFHGYTQKEVAQRLGIPLGTVKTRIRLGLLKLRSLLGPGMGMEA